MEQIILGSLVRQAKGSEQLCQLLQEEYGLLRAGQPEQVTGQEMLIQELIRQLVREREFLLRRLQAAGQSKLFELLDGLEPSRRREFETWQAKIIVHEQESARQASINAELAMALWKQSGLLLGHFQKQIAPKERNVYTAKGTWQNRPSTATLVRGRF